MTVARVHLGAYTDSVARRFPLAALVALMALFALGPFAGALNGAPAGLPARAGGATVVVGHIEGAITPITARYVERVIGDAQADGASAAIFVINTPGGLIDATYQITTAFLNAPVPVVTYVAPSGARAASAGTFITMAGHIAAMAPATNIGAAHPVDSSGGDIQGDLRLKAENDAVAEITKVARARGRNVQWAEDAVRKSVSVRDDEALTLGVVDLVAADVPELLERIDGRSIHVGNKTMTLATRGVALDEDPPNFFETFLHFVVDPQVSVILFSLGTLALAVEMYSPGLILPGIVGFISIVLALFSFGTLDANAAGIALMLFAIVLFIADVKMPTHGFLTAGAVASLVLGAIVLFPPARPTFPGLRNSADPVTIIVVVGALALFFGYVVRVAIGSRRLPVATGPGILIGTLGTAKTDLAPTGIVRAGDDEWSALSEAGPIPKGAAVRVRRVDGVRLIVGPESSSGRREG